MSTLVLALGSLVVLVTGAVLPRFSVTVSEWDRAVLEWVAAQRSPALDALFAALTWLGSLWVLLPLAALAAAALIARGRTADALRFAAAFGGATALGYAAKFIAGRERPAVSEPLVEMPADASFPSGHAMQITAFALAAIAMFAPPAHRGPWLLVGLALILAVGASRLYLQVHFPLDVVAGTAAAALWVACFVAQRRARA